MDPQAFQQTLNSYSPQQQTPSSIYSQPQQTPQAPQPAPSGNWFTHLLPTIGGVIGGLGGGLLTGGLGGVAGGAGGAGLGKALENDLEHKSLDSGVLGQAALGGVGEGVGGVLGKVGGRVLGAVGDKSGQLADNLVKGQFAKGTISGDSANALRTLGLTDARQIPQVSDLVTGTGGALNKGVEKTLMTAGSPVDVTGLIGSKLSPNGMANDLIDSETALSPTAGTKILGTVNKSVQNMLGGPEGMIGNQVADPLDALKQSRVFSGLAGKAQDIATRMGNPEQQSVANVYHNLADELNNRIFTPGGQDVPLTDEVKSEVINNLAPLKDINPTVHTNLVNQVTNASTLQDLRGLQAPFVQGSKAVGATARAVDRGAGATASGTVSGLPIAGAVAGGPHGMLAGLGAQMLRSPTADRAAIPLVQNGGALLSKVGGSEAPGILGGALGVTSATSNNLIQPNSGTVGGNMQPGNSILPQLPQQSPTGGLSRDDLITLALYAPGALASLTPNAQQVQNSTNAQSAESALTGLGNAPQGGILSGLEGKLGLGATGEYQRKAASAAEQVANAIPGSDKGAIQKQLTDYAAGGGNIDDAIKSLLTRLQSVVQSNQNTGLSGILGVNAGAAPQTVTSQLPAMQ